MTSSIELSVTNGTYPTIAGTSSHLHAQPNLIPMIGRGTGKNPGSQLSFVTTQRKGSNSGTASQVLSRILAYLSAAEGKPSGKKL